MGRHVSRSATSDRPIQRTPSSGNPDDDVKRRGPERGGPASRLYSASHTVSSWQFRKWLGVIDQPRTLERYGTMRFHWKVMM